MTERSVTHSTFVIERTYPVPPAKVFAAFADPEIKARWFVGPEGWTPLSMCTIFASAAATSTGADLPVVRSASHRGLGRTRAPDQQ